MNNDYAHLLDGPAKIDWPLFGRAIKAEIARRELTLAAVETETRLSRASVSRASVGVKIEEAAFLKLCIWADLNPFEVLAPFEVPGIAPARVFHAKPVLKLSENKEVSI